MKNESFWLRQRRRVSRKPGTVNLNAGTMSPTPREVLAAVGRLRGMQASNPSDFLWRRSPRLLAESRRRLAGYLKCRSEDLLLLPNVTWGMNVAAASLDLPAGSEILTTDHEYGAMILAWERLCAERGWQLRRVELPFRSESAEEILRAVEAGFTQRTRVLFFSHVATSTGLVLPAAKLCALARRRGALSVVDGAHAVGMTPVNLERIGADYYGANGHKWLMAPACCGFLHVRHNLRLGLKPAITSWGWGYDPARADEPAPNGGTYWQQNLEFHGCADRTPQMVFGKVLAFRASLGGDRAIFARCRDLAAYTRWRLAESGLIPATPENPELSGALVAGEFADPAAAPADGWLWKTHRIECPVTRAAGRAFLRVSVGWFTTRREVDLLADIMGERLRG